MDAAGLLGDKESFTKLNSYCKEGDVHAKEAGERRRHGEGGVASGQNSAQGPPNASVCGAERGTERRVWNWQLMYYSY